MSIFSGAKRRYKSAARYNQILKVLFKYGFEDLVQHLEERKRFNFLRKLIPSSSRQHALQYSKWAKMRLVCEELGPTFVKFGQIMSNRPDLIPFELVLELEKLQDQVPPMSEGSAKEVVETMLRDKVENIFAWFEPKPFASASMAQVHKVILHNGKRVALKIQRPGIKEVILEDIKVMYRVAYLLERRIPSLKSFDPVGLVRNFENSILKELDFINESINVQRFYNNINQDKGKDQYAVAPKVYRAFTSDKVLALEYMSGTKIDHIDQLIEKDLKPKVIAKRLTKSFFKQIFEYGFFHADPHPGNLLVTAKSEICYLDFGMMGSILPRDIEIFGRLFLAITKEDVNRIIQALLDLSNETSIQNMRAFELDVNEFLEKYYVRDIHENEMSTILLELKDIIVSHGLKVPSHFFLFARALVTVEGVIEKLDPELSQFDLVKPYLLKSVSRSYDPIKLGEKVIKSIYELGNYLEELPRDIKNVIHKINSGQVQVDLSHQGIDPMVHIIQRVTKQLLSAFIIVALIVAAVLFIINYIDPLYKGISVFGIAALAIAAIIAFGMLWNIGKGDYDR